MGEKLPSKHKTPEGHTTHTPARTHAPSPQKSTSSSPHPDDESKYKIS